jgi:hypothetical protein
MERWVLTGQLLIKEKSDDGLLTKATIETWKISYLLCKICFNIIFPFVRFTFCTKHTAKICVQTGCFSYPSALLDGKGQGAKFYGPNINETNFQVPGVADEAGSPVFKSVISFEIFRGFSLPWSGLIWSGLIYSGLIHFT